MRTFLTRLIKWIRLFLKKYFDSGNPNLPFHLTILIAAVFFIGALNVFIEIAEELRENDLDQIDNAVTEMVISFRGPALTKVFTFVTHLGDRYAYLVFGVALGVFMYIRYRNWSFIAQGMVVMALSTMSNVVLKDIFDRQRPVIDHLVHVDTLSFPSGHSMSAMAFYGFLIYLSFQFDMRKRQRLALIIPLVTLIFLVGLSRIYLGVHFPSDVAAGYMGGLIWLTFCIIVFNVGSLYLVERRRHDHRLHHRE